MGKGLDALKAYRRHQLGVNVYADEYLDIVEKELEAFEFLKKLTLEELSSVRFPKEKNVLMNKHEVEEFANYEVYMNDGDQYETICLCDTGEKARTIAKDLAMGSEKPNVKIYVTGIYRPGDMIPGGGWYEVFWRDEEGKLREGYLG